MTGPTEKTIRRLFAMSGNTCAFPDCSLPIVERTGVINGEVCHIRAQSPGGPRYDDTQTAKSRHDFENLILMCRRHHKIIDENPDLYSTNALEQLKTTQEKQLGHPEREEDKIFAKFLVNNSHRIKIKSNIGNVIIDSAGAIVASTININKPSKNLKYLPIIGTIGANHEESRYILYLIRRYNEFAAADKSRGTRFSYGAISNNIETRFHGPWRLLPINKFAEVCQYLQERISKTRIAKLKTSKMHRSFSTFNEYIQQE